MTKIGLYAIGTSTTLESNKSLFEVLREGYAFFMCATARMSTTIANPVA